MTFHHMIDLETIDTSPTAGVLSIGIVSFNPDTGELARYRGILRKQFTRHGVHHNALDDAIYQAQYISAMWQGLTKPQVGL